MRKSSRLNKQRSDSTPRSDLGLTEDQKLNVHIEKRMNLFFERCYQEEGWM